MHDDWSPVQVVDVVNNDVVRVENSQGEITTASLEVFRLEEVNVDDVVICQSGYVVKRLNLEEARKSTSRLAQLVRQLQRRFAF